MQCPLKIRESTDSSQHSSDDKRSFKWLFHLNQFEWFEVELEQKTPHFQQKFSFTYATFSFWGKQRTYFGKSLLYCLSLFHSGEVVVIEWNISHDGSLIWVGYCHILSIKQFADSQLFLSNIEGIVQVFDGLVLPQWAIVDKIRPGQREEQGVEWKKDLCLS